MPVKLIEYLWLKTCRENHYKQIKAAFCPATYLYPDSWGDSALSLLYLKACSIGSVNIYITRLVFYRTNGAWLHLTKISTTLRPFWLTYRPNEILKKKTKKERMKERRYYQFSVSLHCYGTCYDTSVHSGLDPRPLACNLQESILFPRVWSPLIDSQYF